MSGEAGRFGEFNIEFELASYRLQEKMEDLFNDYYKNKAIESPDLAQFAQDSADRFIEELSVDTEVYESLVPHISDVHTGFYRIIFDFAIKDESDEIKSVSTTVLAEAFLDIIEKLDLDWAAIAHEWAILSPSMITWEASNPEIANAFSDPDVSFAYTYGLVKSLGSGSGRLGIVKPDNLPPS